MKISLIINTYNRAFILERTLQSLYYLEYPDFEVIVVNGPSADNTKQILDKYKNDIKIGSCKERNLSISRNIGIAMATGKYVAFLDDDAIPDRKWLDKLVEGFVNDEIAGAGGDVYNPDGISYQSRRILSTRFASSNTYYIGNTPVAIPYAPSFIANIGVNSMFRRDALLKIGGFDEQYDYFLDETDVCARAVDAGYYINYVKGADVYHDFSPSGIRDKRKIVLDLTNTFKNIVYYVSLYKNISGEELVNKTIESHVTEAKDGLLYHYNHKNITKTEYNRSLGTLEEGIKLGEESIKRGYPLLIQKETLEKHKSEYKPFPSFFKSDFTKKKTVVFLTHSYKPYDVGGVVTYIYDTATKLAKKGYNVHIITYDNNQYNNASVIFEDNIWVHRIKIKNYDYDFLRSVTTYDIDVLHINVGLLNVSYGIYEEILAISKKYKIDIIHNCFWENLNLYLLQDKNFASKCVTTLVTPCIYIWPNYSSYLALEKYCIENTPNIIGDSNFIHTFCRQYYDKMRLDKTIYLGLEDKFSNNFDNSKIAKNNATIEILFVGRFEVRKGIDLLLSVIPNICKDYSNVVFRLVGRNDFNITDDSKTYKDIFIKQHQNLVDTGKVIFEGEVGDTVSYYNNCDIFVAPSRFESFGFIYVEAMMFSKPVVGTRATATVEVVEDGITGLLSEPENTESLKECLIKLIEDKPLREKLGKAGRKRYEEKFTVDLMVDNLVTYYDEVINKGVN